MNAMDPRSEHTRPAPSRNKPGNWTFTFPDGETVEFSGPSGGSWAAVRGGTRYVLLLTFDYTGAPFVTCKRRIVPAKAHQLPTREQDGLKSVLWVPCKTKEQE